MRTRSDIKRTSESSDSKITLSKNNQKIQNSSSTPRNQKKTQLVKSSSTTPPAVQSEAGVRNGKLLSPRRRALVQTPGRDDVICSQHFDSQMVVGWDCNSPDTLRGIKRISGPGHDDVSDLVMTLIGEEADDEVFTKRNTPPLLGVWKDDSEDKLLDNNNVVVSHRLRRNRGRQRRKSGKESAVSKDLLSKLTLALDKCSEAEEQQSEGEGELLLIGEDGTSKQLNCSDDLFNSESNDNVDVKFTTKSSDVPINDEDFNRNCKDEVESCAKNKGEGDLKLKSNQNSVSCDRIGDKKETEIDESWSDDELFEEDSFIVKATQVSSDMKKFVSPVFGMKRKISSDNVLPKSKCSRFSFQLGASEDKNKNKDPKSEKFTNLQSKQTESKGSSYSKGNMPLVSKPPLHMITKCDNRKPPIPLTRSTFTESKSYTGTQVLNSGANPNPSNSGTNFNRNTPLTRQRTSTSSSYTNSCCNNAVSNVTNSQKPATYSNLSFKKHNSFSGTGSQNFVSSRRRSVSGDKPCDSVTSVENFYGSYKCNPVKNSIARTYPVACNTGTVSNSLKYNTGGTSTTVISTGANKSSISRTCSTVGNTHVSNNPAKSSIVRTCSIVSNTVTTSIARANTSVYNSSTFSHQAYNTKGKTYSTSVTSNKSTVTVPDKNLRNTTSSNITPKSERKPSSVGGFDTSISDDLLCQLAEPDDLLDSQLDVNITCIDKTCVPNKPDQCVSSDISAKQYKFKPSQKNPASSGNNNNNPTKTSGSTFPKASVSKKEPVSAVEQYSEDLFTDDDDMLLADDDGLTEPQILAMLDEVEMLATQQQTVQRNNLGTNQTGVKPNHINTLEIHGQDCKRQSIEKYSTSDYGSDLDGSQGQLAGSQGQPAGSQGQLAGSQGQLAGSQGQLAGSQGQPAGSPGQLTGSQGQSSSQSKYSPAEIERKKKAAMERRKLKLKKT